MISVREHRKAKRFTLMSTATIRWLANDGLVYEAFGTIHDISTCGVLLDTQLSLPIDTRVELEIIPSGLLPQGTRAELHFEGKVVRIVEVPSQRRMALAGLLRLIKPGQRSH